MNNNYSVKATIFNPETKEGFNSDLMFDLECYFIYHEGDYGNGYYLNIVGKGFKKYLDLRYNKDFSRNNPVSFLVSYFENYWNGENGAYKLKRIEVEATE